MTQTLDAPTYVKVDKKVQLACVACVPVGLVVFLVGLLIAGYIPPPPAHDTPQQIADFYRHDTTLIRFGLLLALTGAGLWGPLIAVITRQMLRVGPRNNVLAYVQLGAGAAAWQFLLVPFLALTAAAFRPERSPEITQALHDFGWISLFMPFTPFVVQSLSIALAALTDSDPRPVFPRWLGYFNLLECVLFLPVGLLTFFKTGPFAYHGILVFWVPLVVFGTWLLVMTWAVYRAVLDEHAQAPAGAEGTRDA
jgi:hypothetical protein